jgi:uncharacterized protein
LLAGEILVPQSKPIVTINSRKFDGRVHRSWQAELIERNGSLLTFRGVFEQEVRHSNLGVIRPGTVSYEYYWLDRWYNVFRFHEPEGDLRNYYCNVNLPPKYENEVLDYIDLDIDLVIWSDDRVEVLDIEEFEQNKILYEYSAELVAGCHRSLAELRALIERRKFPFS